MDVRDPSAIGQCFTDEAALSSSARNEGEQRKGQLRDRLAVKPMIRPEVARVAIAKGPADISTEEFRSLEVVQEV